MVSDACYSKGVELSGCRRDKAELLHGAPWAGIERKRGSGCKNVRDQGRVRKSYTSERAISRK